MDEAFWKRYRSAAGLSMGWLSRNQRNPDVGPDRGGILGDRRRLDQPDQRDVPALEDHGQAHPASPQACGRGQGQLVRHARLHLIEAAAPPVGLARLRLRYELEVDTVVGQQTQAPVARVLDGDRTLGTKGRLEKE